MKAELKPAIQAGLTFGIFWGVVLFLCTILHIFTGYPGQVFLYFFKEIYLGYAVSWPGAFIGLIWGFVDGFLIGYIFVWLYNLIGKKMG